VFWRPGGENLTSPLPKHSRISEYPLYAKHGLTKPAFTTTEVNILLSSVLELNKQKLIGMTMGAFIKKFPGLADPKLVREVIESLA